MDRFSELRKLAREKRDAAILAARDEYHEALQEIAMLEKRLKPRKPSLKGRKKPKVPMRVRIMDVVPRDRNFTLAELLELLGLPERESTAVRATLDRLKKRGEIVQVRRGKGHKVALWAVKEFGEEVNVLNQMSMIEAARQVQTELEVPTLMELCVAMLDRGYQPGTDLQTFRKSLQQILGRQNASNS
ncbi:MAG: hypothetical protein AAF483_25850 [Planctomycetota bacterium]